VPIQVSNQPDAFRDFERNGWNAVSEGYEAVFGPLTAQSVDVTLDAAGVIGRCDVLDVCTGHGVLAQAATERGAKVCAVDFSEGHGRRRPSERSVGRFVTRIGPLKFSVPGFAFAAARSVGSASIALMKKPATAGFFMCATLVESIPYCETCSRSFATSLAVRLAPLAPKRAVT
jgi:hypothetical protein